MQKQYLLTLYLLFLSIMLFSQPNNVQLSQTLMEKYAEKEGKNYYKIKGDLIGNSPFKKDSNSKYLLEVLSPSIEYQRISKNIFLRKIDIRFIKSLDDSLISKTESIRDTLSMQQIRQVRAKSPYPYKGEPPLPLVRYLMPSASILGSVAVIVVLFYLRSS